MTFNERQFRDALGLFPTGVAIVTAVSGDGARLGLTVSSFNSVSLSPPLVLFSVARTALSYAAWREAKHYAINVLSEEQSALSSRFARALGDKWEGVSPRVGETGAPLLPNALAWFECEAYAHYDGGDHVIFVGQVVTFRTSGAKNPRPLVFFRGRYRELDPEHVIETPPEEGMLLHGW